MSDKILSMTPEEAYEAGYTAGSKRDWTPCAVGMPKKDGTYMVTIRIDNVFQHGEYESRVRFDQGHWVGMSSDMKVAAWRKESPYRADDTTGKVKEDADDGK